MILGAGPARSIGVVTLVCSAARWRRFSPKRATCINIAMLWVIEVILEQPAKPPHFLSRLTKQTHHPE